MKIPAKTITLTITIRPTYAGVSAVKDEIEDSLWWLTDDHDAIILEWHPKIGVGTWEESEESAPNT